MYIYDPDDTANTIMKNCIRKFSNKIIMGNIIVNKVEIPFFNKRKRKYQNSI